MTERYKTQQRQSTGLATNRGGYSRGAIRSRPGVDVLQDSSSQNQSKTNEVIRSRPAQKTPSSKSGLVTQRMDVPFRAPRPLQLTHQEIPVQPEPGQKPIGPVAEKTIARSSRSVTPPRRVAKRSSVLHRKTVSKPSQRSRQKKQKLRGSLLQTSRNVAALIILGGALLVGGQYGLSKVQQRSPEVLSETAATSSATIDAEQDPFVPSEDAPNAQAIDAHTAESDQPRILSIDSIDLRARVYALGVDQSNQFKAPDNVFDAGWYNGSRVPGETGAVVISGHVSGPSERGIFYYLKALTAGDIVEVEQGDGKVFRYEVVKKQTVAHDNFEVASLLAPFVEGENGLNLVTYDGRFNVLTNDYQDLLVVYAVEL